MVRVLVVFFKVSNFKFWYQFFALILTHIMVISVKVPNFRNCKIFKA